MNNVYYACTRKRHPLFIFIPGAADPERCWATRVWSYLSYISSRVVGSQIMLCVFHGDRVFLPSSLIKFANHCLSFYCRAFARSAEVTGMQSHRCLLQRNNVVMSHLEKDFFSKWVTGKSSVKVHGRSKDYQDSKLFKTS